MALNKNQLKADLLQAMSDASDVNSTTPAERRELLADRFATAIEAYVKSGDGKYQNGSLTAGATAVTSVGGATVIKLN